MKKIPANVFYIMAIVILLAYIFYDTFSRSGKLKDAQKQITQAKREIEIAKDSLSTAQQTISEVVKKLSRTENELQILKTERELIVFQERKKATQNHTELQEFKAAIRLMEVKNDSLKQVAKKFAL